MKKVLLLAIVSIILLSSSVYARQNAVSDAYGNPCLLAEYNGETIRVKTDANGNLLVVGV